MIPTATYQAYNTWGGKSLYFDKNGGADTVSGTKRAVKVSFNRPLTIRTRQRDGYFGPDLDIVYWLEQQGYDVTYTDDVAVHQDPTELRQHEVVLITGALGVLVQRGVQRRQGGQGRRREHRLLQRATPPTGRFATRTAAARSSVTRPSRATARGSSGRVSANDWGPDGLENTADDALGLDRLAGTADDHPENSTTTFRDNGAPPGDPNAPVPGRVGPDMPENQLFGVMYFGDNDSHTTRCDRAGGQPPTASSPADRIWRNTGMPRQRHDDHRQRHRRLGVGLGPDSGPVPAASPPASSAEPARRRRVDDTELAPGRGPPAGDTPPPAGMDGTVHAVKYTAPSGALVFAAGTMQWAWGLSNEPDARIQQSTYNIFSDMGVQPHTPTGVTLDPAGSNQPPIAGSRLPRNPATERRRSTFDGSAHRPIPTASITQATSGTSTATAPTRPTPGVNPVATRAYPDEGTLDVRLRVTDNGGATDFTVRTVNGVRQPGAHRRASPPRRTRRWSARR